MDTLDSSPSQSYNVSLRLIVGSIILIASILMIIYFIKICSVKKGKIENNMQSEAVVIEAAISNELRYAEYFLRLMTQRIQDNYQNKEIVEKLILDYVSLPNFALLFGWRKHSFIDDNFREIITSIDGREPHPKTVGYIKNIVESQNSKWEDKVFYYTRKHLIKNDSLKLISIISSNISSNSDLKKYFGAVVLSYDIATMIRKLNTIKKYESTNFIIIDADKFETIALSSPKIKNIYEDQKISQNILKALSEIDFKKEPFKTTSLVDIFSGINYQIRKVNGLPFILLINLDNEEIKNDIFDTIIKKCVEVSIFCSIFLVIVVSIYKRETSLRNKAELATLRANEVTKAKSSFLSFTVHEIRSPLGFILTGSELMTKELFGAIPAAYKSYAEGIHQNAVAILDFITDILDENQIIEGKFKIVNSIQDIGDIILESINVNKARYNLNKFEIEFIKDPELPELICDHRRILQVMSNLISNAIKYSNPNSKISVTAKMNEDNLEVSVIDQGIGMTPEEIKIALSIHGVVLKKSYNFIQSYGLGLPIVQMLLDAHDADLIIESEQNVGTTVKAIFPKYKLIYRPKKA